MQRLVAWIFAAAMMTVEADVGFGQVYPDKPIRIVTYPPGGSLNSGTDVNVVGSAPLDEST